jgi:predicted fused transcriptional regulator/phosphomethylpyrimidine kinase
LQVIIIIYLRKWSAVIFQAVVVVRKIADSVGFGLEARQIVLLIFSTESHDIEARSAFNIAFSAQTCATFQLQHT